MEYDPIKDMLLKVIKRFPLLRKLFFKALDLLFLRQQYVKREILKMFSLTRQIKFYDAGAGFCQYSDFILSHYPNSKVLASDLKTDYLEAYSSYAQKAYHDRFQWIAADLTEFVPPEKYDLIAAIDILEHISEDEKVLANFFQALQPQGKLIISTPSNWDDTAKFTAEHVRPGYTWNDLRTKLTNAGFIIRGYRYTYGKWGNCSWKIGIKVPLKLVSYSKYMLLLLPLYYICLYPIIYLLMKIDLNTYNSKGNGLLVIAEKPLNAV